MSRDQLDRDGHRHGRRLPGRFAGALLAALTATTVQPAPAQAQTPVQAPVQAQSQSQSQSQAWPGHPDRALVRYVVRPGDTVTGLAVRYHAWTAELIAVNGLGRNGALRLGQELRIPIVLSAVRRAGGRLPTTRPTQPTASRPRRAALPSRLALHTSRPAGHGWLHTDLTRDEVRRLVTRTARLHGVPPRLALAVAWQESGWRQRRVSSTGALGVMQVMPDTGRWMRWYAGRQLRLRDSHDNVLAGVLTLRYLLAHTRRDDSAIAAYYQGLGAVRRRGWFEDTKRYVAAVRAHEGRISRTGEPT
jgi:soluble lytic murein transglycosylase-like protein